LIFYALKDLLADRDFSAWTNIALTSLILFTVILSIFMIMHKPAGYKEAAKPGETTLAAPAALQTPEEIAAEEQRAKEVVTDEYILIEQDCKANAKGIDDCAQLAAKVIIDKYKLTQEEWEDYFREATETGLFDKARAKQNIK